MKRITLWILAILLIPALAFGTLWINGVEQTTGAVLISPDIWGDIDLHDGSTLTMWDEGDDFSVTMAVTDSTTHVRLTGNLDVSANVIVGSTLLPDASSGADIGSTDKEWADVYIADDDEIMFGSDQDIRVGYDETTDDRLEWGDGTNLLMSLTDVGTTGDLAVSGSLKATGIDLNITIHNATEDVLASTMKGNVHVITGAYIETLPPATIGMSGLFRASTAVAFSLDCNGSDHFEMYDGTVLADGNKQTSSATKNEYLYIYCESANIWITIGINGAFTDGGA